MNKIDCHMHLWTLAMEPHYHLWMTPDLTELYRDYGPKDARAVMDHNQVDGVVLVAAASSVEEIGYLLGLADGQDFIKGVVGWLDLLADDAPKQIETWARFPKLKGLRPYLQDMADDAWILQPQLDPAIQAVMDNGLRFDALIKPHQVKNCVRFIEKYPDLPVIIDHLAKPNVTEGAFDPWQDAMEEFRQITHVHCKLSGLVTEDGPDWTLARITPYLDAVCDIFGPDRLVFGSDWPVVNLVADYTTWIETLSTYLEKFDSSEQSAIWSGNGARFYGLE